MTLLINIAVVSWIVSIMKININLNSSSGCGLENRALSIKNIICIIISIIKFLYALLTLIFNCSFKDNRKIIGTSRTQASLKTVIGPCKLIRSKGASMRYKAMKK
jgi:hypothetical protein